MPPSPPLPLKRPDIEKDYDYTFLPPQISTVDALKTDFDRPITNLIDKANNIIEVVLKNKKQDLDYYDNHLSEQLSKLFPKVEGGGGGGYLGQERDQKINELPIPELSQLPIPDLIRVRYQSNFNFLREVKTKNLKIK